MSLLHSDYYIVSFATPPKKTKFNAFTNKNQAYEAYELNIQLSEPIFILLRCCWKIFKLQLHTTTSEF